MQNLLENLLSLGRQRLMVLAAAGIGMVAALLLGLGAISRPDFQPLYNNLSVTAANSIESTLANAGFAVEVSPDGSSVSVPRAEGPRARMVLAEAGVAIDGEPGWELFDDQSGLAMNSFLQKINRIRALEGELARSIQTLDGISSARVHLVLPEREPFSRVASSPSGSIIVRPEAGHAVTRKQAIAVRNLVASAVPDLELHRVTVLSASGETILADNNDGDGTADRHSAQSGIEDRLAAEITNILTARVGAGNARVRVNVEMTTEREVIVSQSFDPDQQVVRSTETKSENQTGVEGGGNVGVENNIPAALADGAGGTSTNRQEADERVQYEIGNTRREVVREAGDVKRLTVAVLVNGIYNVEGSDVAYAERTPEELDRLTELVKSAVGFNESRGDSVSVDSMRFMDYSMDLGDPVERTMSQTLSDNIVSIVQGLLALVVVALVLVLGVRPLIARLAPDSSEKAEREAALPVPEDGAEAAAMAAAQEGAGQPQALLPDGRTATGARPPAALAPRDTALALAGGDAASEDYITKQGIKGDLNRRSVETIQQLADDQPEDVLRVLKGWLMTEAEA